MAGEEDGAAQIASPLQEGLVGGRCRLGTSAFVIRAQINQCVPLPRGWSMLQTLRLWLRLGLSALSRSLPGITDK